MRDEEKDIDEEREECEKKCKDAEDEDTKEVAWGVRWCVEVGDAGEDEHNEGEEAGDGVDYQDSGDGAAGCDGNVKVVFVA